MRAERPEGSVSLEFAARLLSKRGIDTGRRRIFKQLRKAGLMDGRHATLEALKRGLLLESEGDFAKVGKDLALWTGEYTRIFVPGDKIEELAKELQAHEWQPRGDVELGVPEKCELGL